MNRPMQDLNSGKQPLPGLTTFGLLVAAAGAGTSALVAPQFWQPQHAWLSALPLALLAASLNAGSVPGIEPRVLLGQAAFSVCAAALGTSPGDLAVVLNLTVTSLRTLDRPQKISDRIARLAASRAAGLRRPGQAGPDPADRHPEKRLKTLKLFAPLHDIGDGES